MSACDLTSTKVSYQEDLFVSDELLKNIVRLQVTMYDVIFVNEEEWDADHRENSKNLFLWNHFCFCVAVDNIL
jgi:hypothetical protein